MTTMVIGSTQTQKSVANTPVFHVYMFPQPRNKTIHLYCRILICHIILVAACCCLAGAVADETNSSANTAQHIEIDITTHLGDEQHFREGDIVSFYISLNRDAYILLVYQDSENKLYLLLPNTLYKNNYYQAGLFIPIPNQANPFQFRIGPPYGKDTLWAFASDRPFPTMDTATEIGGASVLPQDIESIRTFLKDFSRQNNSALAQTSLNIFTSPK